MAVDIVRPGQPDKTAPANVQIAPRTVGRTFFGVEGRQARMDFAGEGRPPGCRDVVVELRRLADPGDDGRDRRMIEQPAQRELRQRPGPWCFSASRSWTRVDAGFERDARKGFADRKGGAVAIIVAVVFPARISAPCRTCPTNSPLASGSRTMMPTSAFCACGSSSVAASWRNRLKMICSVEMFGFLRQSRPLRYGLDAGTVVANQPVLPQIVEPGEDRAVPPAPWWARSAAARGRWSSDAEPFSRAGQALLDPGLGVLVRKQAAIAPDLGRDLDAVAALEPGADPALALPAAIDVGGVPEIHPVGERLVEDGSGQLVVDGAEIAAKLPAAEPDFGNLIIGPCQAGRCCMLLSPSMQNPVAGPLGPSRKLDRRTVSLFALASSIAEIAH